MCKLALVLAFLPFLGHARRVQPAADIQQSSSNVITPSTLDPLRAVATLLVGHNPSAAFNSATASSGFKVSHQVGATKEHHKVASEASSRTVRPLMKDPYNPDGPLTESDVAYAKEVQKQKMFRKDALKVQKEKLRGVPLYYVGLTSDSASVGSHTANALERPRLRMGDVMAKKYDENRNLLLSDKPDAINAVLNLQSQRATYEGLVKQENLTTMDALAEQVWEDVQSDFEDMENNFVMAVPPGFLKDEDVKRMKDSGGYIIHIDFGDNTKDIPLPAEDAEKTLEGWRENLKKADVRIDVSEFKRNDHAAIHAWEKFKDFLTRDAAGLSGPLYEELMGLKVSALRKRAVAAEVDEKDLDEADDADDTKEQLIKLIMAKNGKLYAELTGLSGSDLRKRAVAAGASEKELDDADDADDTDRKSVV